VVEISCPHAKTRRDETLSCRFGPGGHAPQQGWFS